MKMTVEIGGMTLTGNTAVRGEKLVPEPHCPPQISHELAWDRTRASVVIKSKIILKGIQISSSHGSLYSTLTASVMYQNVSAVWGNDRCLF